jgi:uncharacterized protein (TIGR03437 family)
VEGKNSLSFGVSSRTSVLAYFVGLALSSVVLWAQQAPPVASLNAPRKAALPAGLTLERSQLERSLPVIEMGSLSDEEHFSRLRHGVRQVGVKRILPVGVLDKGTTVSSPNGQRIWRVALHSTGAAGIRVHFREFSIGNGQVWVYAPASSDPRHSGIAGPYTDKGLFHDGEFWSATVNSDTVVVEYDAKAGSQSGALFPPFRVDAISHQWASGASPRASADMAPLLASFVSAAPAASAAGSADDLGYSAAPCELDVSCYPSYSQNAAGVAQYNFVDDSGGAFLCSGGLLNTTSSLPYMLTAHHCVSTDSEARSVEAHFLYQTSTCNGTPPDLSTVPRLEGGHYLVGADVGQGDYSLLLLNGTAPPGTTLLGWTTADPNFGDQVVGIHHPEGSWKRISFGSRTTDTDVSVNGVIGPANLYYQIDFTQGIIEPGSSGSPLFNSSGQIVGIAADSPDTPSSTSACSIHPFIATFGRFSDAYAALKPYLDGQPGGAVNSASYLPGAAPGMLLSVFAQNLSTGTQLASSVPLPMNMQGTSAAVNGTPAPLLYVSPTQVNLQVPYETQLATAIVTITSGSGQTTTTEVQVTATMPGIFTDTSGHVVPSTSARRGTYATLFITGQGLVSPAVVDGAAPPPPSQVPVTGLPVPLLPVTVFIGDTPIQAQTSFVGIPYYLVGVTQINFIVPRGLPTGDQLVVVYVGNVPSPAAHINVTP